MVDRCISYAPVCGGEQVKGGRAGVQQAEVGGRWGQVAAEHGRPGASALEALEGGTNKIPDRAELAAKERGPGNTKALGLSSEEDLPSWP